MAAEFPTLDWEKALVDGLIKKGEANAKLSGEGAREKAMANLAEPIAEAIKHGGGSIHWVTNLTVAALNALQSPELGGIYGVKDSGVLVNKDGSRIPVDPNDAVIWNGEKWGSFIDIDLSDYAKKEYVTTAVASEATLRVAGDENNAAAIRANAEAIESHISDKDNPHKVTAEQVGAYTKEQVTTILETFDLTDDALGRERELRDLIDSVAHGTNMVAFEEGQDVFMTILDYFARKPVPYAATFYSDVGATTNTLTNVPPILVTDKQTAGFKVDCFCLFDVDSPGSDDKPDYARSILLEYTNNKSDAGYIKFLGRIGNSSHTRPTKPSNSYWEQFLNGKMCDGTFNYKSNKVATVKTVTDKINALDVNDAAVANQFVTAVKETDGKVSVSRRQPVIGDVSGLQASLDVKAEKDEVSSAIAAHNASPESHEDIRSAVRDETSARVLYDSQLRESIEALEEKAEEFVTGEEVSEAIAAEADARIQEDIALNARIDMIPQTDWNETDEGSMAYLANHPTPISDLDIEALFS